MGTIGELAIAQDLIVRGFDVYTSVGDNAKADLVAVYGTTTYRIQVKTTSHVSKGVVCVGGAKYVAGKQVTYEANDVDIIAAYVAQEKLIAYIPISEFLTNSKSRTLVLRVEPPKRNKKNARYLKDYTNLSM